MRKIFILAALSLTGCYDFVPPGKELPDKESLIHKHITDKGPFVSKKYRDGSWEKFLQELPVRKGPVVNYQGLPIEDQGKHDDLIDLDVGKNDLQQCADAIIRLRAEFLFSQNRFSEIGFQFTSGQLYRWEDFCKGKIPVVSGNQVHFIQKQHSPFDHKSLRRYLDYVYAYSGTISLAKELKEAEKFGTGTVVIKPGSPGHCFIIIDEAERAGEKFYRLAEGYTPAQSIYVLKNVYEPHLGPWHRLDRGIITTSSYQFATYKLGKFE